MGLAVIGAVLGLTGVLAVLGSWRWHAESARVEVALRAHERRPGRPFHPDDLATLPPPVVRYFRRVLKDGQPMITSARITWAGQFNMGKPGKNNWRPFTAVQLFVPAAPGFVWNARIALFPGVSVKVRDSFVEGCGSMHGAVLGLIPVVRAEGTPTLASGALQRYLGEAAWLPTALLPRSGVTWTAIDESRARATISAAQTTVSLEFRFDADGHPISVFAPDRFYDDGKGTPVPRPWEARNLRFSEQHGMMVPTESEVEWQLPTGPFVYWRGHAVAVEYRYEGALEARES